MTPEDNDTTRGDEEEADVDAPGDAETDVPPRDPETGKFLPKDDRPTEGAGEGPNADKPEPASMSEESDSEPTADEEAPESSTGAGAPDTEPPAAAPDAEREADSREETAVTEPEQNDETTEQARTTAPDREAAPTAPTTTPGREAGAASTTVFVTNPNGYPRPATTFLPSHPWLRLPSRPPAHETVSSRR